MESIEFYDNTCICSYINPDLDGFASAYALNQIIIKCSLKSSIALHGVLNNETICAIEMLNIDKSNYEKSKFSEFSNIILVDTHNPLQIDNSISNEKVYLILDHHEDGRASSFPNAKIINQKIGAVCTIIAEYVLNKEIEIDVKLSKILALGIISNTVNFTAPSTARRDIDVYQKLNNLFPIQDSEIEALLLSKSDISNLKTIDILIQNLKIFELNESKIGIIQIESFDFNTFYKREDIQTGLNFIKNEKDLFDIMTTFIDIKESETNLVFYSEKTKENFENILDITIDKSPYKVEKILLRKTDFIPNLNRVKL